jgi:hypothetical protein
MFGKPMYAVRLRRSRDVRFPDRCVGCDGDPKGRAAAVWDHETAWWSYFVYFGRFVSLQVPACFACKVRIFVEQLVKYLFLIGGTALLLWFFFPSAATLPRGLLRVFTTVLFLVFGYGISLAAWLFIVPRTVELDVRSEWMAMEFDDEDYALDFEVLNHEIVLLPVNETG